MRKTILALALSAALPVIAHAAEAPKSSVSLTGNMTLASEYIFRGIAQTNHKPAVQAGLDLAHDSGLYLGVWSSNISWLSDAGAGSSGVETDIYGGYKGELSGISYDVGLLEYYYPGTYAAGVNSPNTLEGYVGVGYKGVTLKYSHSFTDLFGYTDSKNSGYLDLSGSYEVGAGVTVSAHVGHQKIAGDGNSDFSYTDYKIGVAKEFFGLNTSLAYSASNAKEALYTNAYGTDTGEGRVIFSVGKTF